MGYKPLNKRICDQIIAEIKSKFRHKKGKLGWKGFHSMIHTKTKNYLGPRNQVHRLYIGKKLRNFFVSPKFLRQLKKRPKLSRRRSRSSNRKVSRRSVSRKIRRSKRRY